MQSARQRERGRRRRFIGAEGLLVLILVTGCRRKSEPKVTTSIPPKKVATGTTAGTVKKVIPIVEVTFPTADGWTIHADFASVPSAKKAVVLLHQRNGSAADWKPVIPKLTDANVTVLALDQRGAGRSTGAQNGDNAPWDTTGDITAAVQWLGTKGFKPKDVALGGASYGANNALIYAAAHPETPAVALMSPGKDYHGLKIEPAARAYKGHVLILTAPQDPITEGGPDLLYKVAPRVPDQGLYPGKAHGTELFAAQPQTADALRDFFGRL